MDVVGYARVSSIEQTKGYSISNQKRRIKEYCAKKDYNLKKIFLDPGISGERLKRPGLDEMFNYLDDRRDIEQVIITKLDRLIRKTATFNILMLKFQKRNLQFECTDESISYDGVMNTFVAHLWAAVAQLTHDVVVAQMDEGRYEKFRQGGYAGGCPGYGFYVHNKELYIHPQQAWVVRTLFKNFVYHNKTVGDLRKIGMALDPDSLKWSDSNVRSVLRNIRHAGIHRYGDEFRYANHGPIVPFELWWEANHRLDKRFTEITVDSRNPVIMNFKQISYQEEVQDFLASY